MNILVTGSSGFVGGRLASRLEMDPTVQLVLPVRQNHHVGKKSQVVISEINGSTDWTKMLQGVDLVVHAAARVHVMAEKSENPLNEFRKVNVDGTASLARQSAMAGVKRFIYISTVKVNGESTDGRQPFHVSEDPSPKDAYGISKMESELVLRDISRETGMEVVVIRPPLVYGPGVKGNFPQLIKMIQKNVPLPFGSIRNARSFVAIDNLVDLISVCLIHPNAANQTFLISDDQDLSTTELLKRIAHVSGRRSTLIPLPPFLLKMLFTILGKRDISDRLLGSLQVDIQKTKEELNWSPPVQVNDGLRRCIEGAV